MAPSTSPTFPLADCHESILQRIIDLSDASDLFLLRQVSRRFREAVGRRIRRIRLEEPFALSADFASKFPSLVSLDLENLHHPTSLDHPMPELPAWLAVVVPKLPHLKELLHLDLSSADEPVEWRLIVQHLTRLWVSLDICDYEAEDMIIEFAPHLCSLQLLQFFYLHRRTLRQVTQQAASLTELDGSVEYPSFDEDEDAEKDLLKLNTGRLQTLRLEDECMYEDDIPQLATFTSLTALELKIIPDKDLSQLASLTGLTSLRLCRAGSGLGVASLTRLSRLAELHLTDFSPEPAEALGTLVAGFSGLTALNIDTPKEAVLGSSLHGLTRLTRLSAKYSSILSEPQALRGLSQLRHLNAQNSLSAESQLRHLSELVQLTRLDVSTCSDSELSHEGLSWLADTTALEVLLLHGVSSFTGGAFEQLARLPALRALDLSCQQTSGLPPLFPLERLQRLQWLKPHKYEQICKLPPRLVVPALKGRRWLAPPRLGVGDLDRVYCDYREDD